MKCASCFAFFHIVLCVPLFWEREREERDLSGKTYRLFIRYVQQTHTQMNSNNSNRTKGPDILFAITYLQVVVPDNLLLGFISWFMFDEHFQQCM